MKMKRLLPVALVAALLLVPATAFALGFSDQGSAGVPKGSSSGGGSTAKLTYYEFTALKSAMTSWTTGGKFYYPKDAAKTWSVVGSTAKTNFTEYDRGSDDSGAMWWNCFIVIPTSNDAALDGSSTYKYLNYESREDGANLSHLSNGTTFFSPEEMRHNFWSGTTSKAAGGSSAVLGAFRPGYNTLASSDDMTINALYPTLKRSGDFEHYLPSDGFAGNNSGNGVDGNTGFVRGNTLGKTKNLSANLAGKPRINFDMGAVFNNLENKEGRYTLYWFRMNAFERVLTSGYSKTTIVRPRVRIQVVDTAGELVKADWTLSQAGVDYLVNRDNQSSAGTVFGSRDGKAGGPAYLKPGESLSSGMALPNSYAGTSYTLVINATVPFNSSITTGTYQPMADVLAGGSNAVDWSPYLQQRTISADGLTLTITGIALGDIQLDNALGGLYHITVALSDTDVFIQQDGTLPISDISGPASWLNSNKPATFIFPSIPDQSAKQVQTDGSYLEAKPFAYYLHAPVDFNWAAANVANPRDLRSVDYTELKDTKPITVVGHWTRENAVHPSAVLGVALPDSNITFATAGLAEAARQTVPYGTHLTGGNRVYGAVLYEVRSYTSAGVFIKVVGYRWGNLAIKNVSVFTSAGVD